MSNHRMYDTRPHKAHLALFHERRREVGASGININAVHEESMSGLDRLALVVTRRLGTFGTFLLIAGWTVLWLSWNILAPRGWRFDPAPAFVFWLFISNMIQICLMPLIMIGQNLEARHSDLRAEQDYHVNQESFAILERQNETLEAHSQELLKQTATLDTLPGLLTRIEERLKAVEAKLPAKRVSGNGKPPQPGGSAA